MNSIEIGICKLVFFDKKNENHLKYLKYLLSDDTIYSRFQGIFSALVSKNDFFDKGFLIEHDNEYIGCVLFGKYNPNERNVYIRGFALDKDHRGKKISDNIALGECVNNEINEYIFATYPDVDSIIITVSTENPLGKRAAVRYGYSQISDTHYLKHR